MLARIRKAIEERESGFTLIELLVVMIIIGILAAIAIPTFLSQKSKAHESAEKSDATSIATDIASALVDGSVSGMDTGPWTGPVTDQVINYTDGTGTASSMKENITDGVKITISGDVTTAGGGTTYCVLAEYPSDTSTKSWHYDQNGLASGACA